MVFRQEGNLGTLWEGLKGCEAIRQGYEEGGSYTWCGYGVYNGSGLYMRVREEIKRLKKSEKEKGVEEVMKDMDLWSELEEAKAQWEYYENLYNEEKEDKQERIRRCFRRIKQIKPSADWEEFRDWVMSDEE